MSNPPSGSPNPLSESSSEGAPALTDEQRMLLDLRDVLYEGSWEDFRNDLKARQESRPHVFEIVPPSPGLKETIERHLGVIDELERWERRHGHPLRSDA